MKGNGRRTGERGREQLGLRMAISTKESTLKISERAQES